MGIGIAGVRHIKLPVTDLERSVSWYRELLDLELWMELGAALLEGPLLCELPLVLVVLVGLMR